MDGMTHRAVSGAGGGDEQSASRMTEMLAAPTTADGWKVEDVNIRRATNGGFIVRCSKTKDAPAGSAGNQPSSSVPTYKSDEYAFSNLSEAVSFLTSELGGGAAPGASVDAPMAAGEGVY